MSGADTGTPDNYTDTLHKHTKIAHGHSSSPVGNGKFSQKNKTNNIHSTDLKTLNNFTSLSSSTGAPNYPNSTATVD